MRHVVLTRERGQNERLREWLPDGWTVAEVPVTTTDLYDEAAVLAEVHGSGHFGSIASLVVTSARSARYAAVVAPALCADAECFSVGAATTAALGAVGQRVAVQSAGAAIDLARQIARYPVLVLAARTSRDELVDSLREQGVDVVVVACYETRPLTLSEEQRAELARADAVMVGAPSAWSVLEGTVPSGALVVVPGATTAAAVRASHARVLEGWGPTLRERLVDALGRGEH